MTTYAVGDVQGCYASLRRLLDRLEFEPARDRLLFVGDLVNRGPQSLETLRFVKSLGPASATVLGNHDLHLLASARSGRFGTRDTLAPLMRAADRDELLHWLRRQPLAWFDPDSASLLVHAGLPPQWDLAQTLALARETQQALAGAEGDGLLDHMYGNEPHRWSEALQGFERHRFVINCLTRLRYCRADGRIDFKHKGAPGSQPAGLLPWYEVPGRRSAGLRVVFGHWSTLGCVRLQDGAVLCLDSGCVWGQRLSAVALGSGVLTQVDCAGDGRTPD